MSILSNIRVLDFGRYVAGPYCATLLGYLGAEVIRVEKRGGSEDRFIAPIIPQTGEGSVLFQTSCNKKSLTLDLGKPPATEIIHRLAASADVVVANLPAGTLQSLQLDYPTLSRINPRIIVATQTAFGDAGPYRDLGGFDGIGQAMSGAMYMSGTPEHPAKAAAPYVDFTTAVLAAFGTLAALMAREQSGVGQEVKTSLLGTALSVFNSHLIEQAVLSINRRGTGNRVQTSAPSDVFATRDGHILTHVVGNGLFRRWARLMGDEHSWIDDPRFGTDQSRGDHSEAILTRMRAWCAERTTTAAVGELQAAGIPAGPIYTPQQALDDPQVHAMQFLKLIDDYPGLPRPATVADIPVRLSATPAGVRSRPPLIGEHTDEILAELGYAAAEIEQLRAQQII